MIEPLLDQGDSYRAALLGRLKRSDEALAGSQTALSLVSGGRAPELRRAWATALGAQSIALSGLGRHQEARQVAEQTADEFAEDPVQGPRAWPRRLRS